MARRIIRYPEKPWRPDPEKWKKFLIPAKERANITAPLQPTIGWQLWDWRTLKDVPQ